MCNESANYMIAELNYVIYFQFYSWQLKIMFKSWKRLFMMFVLLPTTYATKDYWWRGCLFLSSSCWEFFSLVLEAQLYLDVAFYGLFLLQ